MPHTHTHTHATQLNRVNHSPLRSCLPDESDTVALTTKYD